MISVRSLRRFSVLASVTLFAISMPVLDIPDRIEITHRTIELRANGPLRAPVEFGLIGLTWPDSQTAPSGVRVRTSLDGQRWSSWTPLDADEVDLGPDARTEGLPIRSTTPLWVAKARFADVRVAGRPPKGALVHVIDPGPDPRDPRGVLASPSQPRVLSRAEWGADESMRKCCPRYASTFKGVIIHHTATGNSYTPGESAAIVRSIYAYHVQSNGWDDIGYSFLVDRYGQIFEGRAGGVTKAVIGAHAQGFNTGTAGIAVIGSFGSARPPQAAWDALTHLASWRLDRHFIDPRSITTMTSAGSSKYAAGESVTLPRVSAHRDVGTTSCPGQPFYDSLAALRAAVANHGDPKIYSPWRTRPVITPNGDGVADSTRLTAQFSSPTSWKVGVMDPKGWNWRTFSGSGTTIDVTWDGKKSNGQVVPHDNFRFVISASNERGTIRSVALPIGAWSFPNGTLFRTTTSRWQGLLEAGKLRRYLTRYAAFTRHQPSEEAFVSDDLLKVYPIGSNIGFRNGSIVRADAKLWFISDQKRRPVTRSTLDALGFDRRAIIETTASRLSPHPAGEPLTVSEGYPNGTAFKGSDFREAILRHSKPRLFPTKTVRLSHGIRDVELVGPADARLLEAQTNAPMGFRDGTLLRSQSSSHVYVVADGLRRYITSSHRFEALGYRWESIRQVTDAELALHAEGPPL